MGISEINYDIQFEPLFSNFTFKGMEILSFKTTPSNKFVLNCAEIKIKSSDHYQELGYNDNVITGRTVVAKNPGLQFNGLRVAIIDGKADQILENVDVSSPCLLYTSDAADE